MTSTRDRIKQAALELFVRNGFSGTTIGAIEREAGLAPRAGAFYRHFESKAALLAELAREKISETPDEFDFDALKALGNTRAELVMIAQVYERAGRRQMPYLRLIEEVRLLAEGSAFESQLNKDLLDALSDWVATKPAARRLGVIPLTALTVNVFGAWLFYLGKVQQGMKVDTVDRDALLDAWASHWAGVLDRPRI
jgi:AcrR family transcriptional regulator